MIFDRIRGNASFVAISTALLATAWPTATAQGQTSSEAVASDGEDVRSLETITVTARRRAESLQSVPASVSALTGDELETKSLDDLGEAAAFVPNLSLSQAGTNANGAAVFIRGVGQSAPRVNLDPGVGIYVDGVYRASIDGGFLDFVDVERIEVLRGPQGTLYGRNTIGGAVKIETIKPDPSGSSAKVGATVGNLERVDVRGAFNIPIVEDKLAFKLSGGSRQADGYVTRGDGEKAGDQDSQSVLAQLRWIASDRVDVLFSADYTQSENFGLAKYHTVSNPTTLSTAYNGAVQGGFLPGPEYDASQLILNDTRANNDTSEFARVDFEEWGLSSVISFEGDGFTINSYTAYRDSEQLDGFDTDGSAIDLAANDRFREFSQFSQELQLNTSLFDGFIDLVGGVYYFEGESFQRAIQRSAPDFIPLGQDLSTGSTSEQDLTSFSAYSEAKFNISDALSLSAGLRYVYEEKDVTGTAITTALTTPVIATQSASDNWSTVSPRFVAEYQASDDLLVYASATRGFKSGGLNDTASFADPQPPLESFDPEELWAYEVGIKSELFSNRLRLNVAGFYSDYESLQLRLFELTDLGLVRQFLNAGGAEVTGLEVETLFAVTENFRLQFAGALLDSEFTEDVVDARGSTLITAGEPLERAPEASYTFGGQYDVSLDASTDLTLRADYSWQDETVFGLTGGDGRRGSDAYGLLNLSAAVRRGPVTLTAFGKNVTDEEYVTGSLASGAVGTTFFYLGRPQEYGLRLSYDF